MPSLGKRLPAPQREGRDTRVVPVQTATAKRVDVPIWHVAPLSTLIRDPFVRRAFERAEREDGTAPATVAADPHRPMRGGAVARREAADA